MELVYAALLLHSLKKPIEEASLKKIVDAAGGDADSARIKALVGSLKDVDIEEAIKQSALTAAVAAPATSPKAEKKDEKKEEESEEEQEKKAEEAAGGLSSLFG